MSLGGGLVRGGVRRLVGVQVGLMAGVKDFMVLGWDFITFFLIFHLFPH